MIQDMTRGKPLQLLTAFALPLMFGNIFQQLYTVADIAVIGRGIGMDALAALGCVDWLNWMMIGIATAASEKSMAMFMNCMAYLPPLRLRDRYSTSALSNGIFVFIGA